MSGFHFSPIELLRHLNRIAGKSPNAIALDVGAHVGAFSRELIDSRLYGRVIAFEPNPANVVELEVLAATRPVLTVVTKCVGAADGAANFYYDDDTATGSLLAYGENYETKGPRRSIKVAVVSLDIYLAQHSTRPPVALLKIDTQGNDLAVIRGASITLAKDRPFVIAEVIYLPLYAGQSTPESIFDLMRSKDYDTYTLFNIHVTVEGRIAYADALFVPRELAIPYSQEFVQVDNNVSYRTQIETLNAICAERLDVINVLDAEVRRLRNTQ